MQDFYKFIYIFAIILMESVRLNRATVDSFHSR